MENEKMENGFSMVDPLVEMGCRMSRVLDAKGLVAA